MKELQLGMQDYAKYPFLREAGEYVRSLEVSLEDLEKSDYAHVLRRAKNRVLDGALKGKISENLREIETEILSFPLALMLAKATGLEHLANRYSLAEALRIEKFLEEEDDSVVTYIFNSVLNVEIGRLSSDENDFDTYEYKMSMVEFLKRADFHKLEWKLVNRLVGDGHVYVKKRELVRLIRDEIKKMIYGRIKTLTVAKLSPQLKAIVDEIVQLAPPPPRGRELFSSTGKYPPCVIHALEMLKKGENLPHYGRFLLATFMLNIGKSVDEVVDYYSQAPDFNEKITRYQVEHIAGLKGGRTKYNVPSCKTLQTHSFCFRTAECDGIRNPIRFGRQPTTAVAGRERSTRRRPLK